MSPDLGRSIILIAQSLVGSHYINGAYGATPGRLDGCPCRPGGIDLIADERHLDPKFNKANKKANLAVNAATMSVKSYCVCAGNSSTVRDGGPTTETDPDLVQYLASLDASQPSTWRPYEWDLTPRRAFGPGQNGGDIGGKLVWGQSCRDVRHFDCVGFISYCYWKASGAVMQLDISAWRTPSGGRQVFKFGKIGEDEQKAGCKPPPAALMDGDILVKADHHIAYVSANGTIIEAQDTDLGVRSTAGFRLGAPNTWTHLVRLGGGAASDDPDWPLGWWRVWDGGTWYYYFAEDNTVMSSRSSPFNTRKPPAKAHNTGTWSFTPPRTLVVAWKKVAGAPAPCVETFYNAQKGFDQMNATSTLYSPLVATRMV